MEDFSIESKSYPGKHERVSQDKCARTLTNCYRQFDRVVWLRNFLAIPCNF